MNFFSTERLALERPVHLERMIWREPGEHFDAGDRRLRLVLPPIFDGPATRGLFDEKTGVLWSVDTFAALTTGAVHHVEDLPKDLYEESFMFFNSLVSPWHQFLDPVRYNRHVDTVEALKPRVDRQRPRPDPRRRRRSTTPSTGSAPSPASRSSPRPARRPSTRSSPASPNSPPPDPTGREILNHDPAPPFQRVRARVSHPRREVPHGARQVHPKRARRWLLHGARRRHGPGRERGTARSRRPRPSCCPRRPSRSPSRRALRLPLRTCRHRRPRSRFRRFPRRFRRFPPSVVTIPTSVVTIPAGGDDSHAGRDDSHVRW